MWDVVDVGIKPDVEWAGVTGAGGKEQEGTNGADVVLLDASTINVYQVRYTEPRFCYQGTLYFFSDVKCVELRMVQGCDGMVICFDPSKRATYEYAVSMIKKGVSSFLPVSSPSSCMH
jgi:hypothetical protein